MSNPMRMFEKTNNLDENYDFDSITSAQKMRLTRTIFQRQRNLVNASFHGTTYKIALLETDHFSEKWSVETDHFSEIVARLKGTMSSKELKDLIVSFI